MEALPLGGMERLSALENAIDALIGPDALRRELFGHEKFVGTLYRAVNPRLPPEGGCSINPQIGDRGHVGHLAGRL